MYGKVVPFRGLLFPGVFERTKKASLESSALTQPCFDFLKC